MLYILLREKGLIHWYPPIYAQTLILYTDAPIRLRSIEIIAFVLGSYEKSVIYWK